MSDIVARVRQGRHDTEAELLRLKRDAERQGWMILLDAVHARLKTVSPLAYRRLVGPLEPRRRDRRFACYCNRPSSREQICHDIMRGRVPRDALACDDCWRDDIASAWGYHGSASRLLRPIWDALCAERAALAGAAPRAAAAAPDGHAGVPPRARAGAFRPWFLLPPR